MCESGRLAGEGFVGGNRHRFQSMIVGIRPMTSRKAEDETRLGAMQEAAEVGIADIEAGRFRVFGSAEELQEHLSALVAEVLESGVRSPD